MKSRDYVIEIPYEPCDHNNLLTLLTLLADGNVIVFILR